MGFLKNIWEWTKGGMQIPKAKAYVESKPVLKEIAAYTPKGGVEAGLAATGIGLIHTVGVAAAGKIIGTGILRTAPKAAKAIIPKTIKGKILAGTGITLGVGILKESKKAREFTGGAIRGIQDKPVEVLGFGEKIGKFIEGTGEKPGVVEGLKKAGLIGGVAALGIGAAVIAPKVIEKVKGWGTDEGLISEKPVGIEGEMPITPETTSMTTKRKPYKRRRAKKTPSVRQYVRVNIINRPVATGMRITNKRYISQELLN